MLTAGQKFGEKSEALAVKFLKKHGYKILEKNYRTQLGEIDIVARDRNTLVFVEVKARRSGRYGHPKWAVTQRKQRKISMVALYYLKTTGQLREKARFDVVTVDSRGQTPELEIIKNAFELSYP